MTKQSQDGVWAVVPHLYVDTNVFGGILEGQHRASIHLLETARDNKWRCSTSIFTLMELVDIRQDNKYIYNQLGLGVHIKKAYRALDKKNLPPDDLAATQDSVDALFSESYPFIEFFSLQDTGWDKAMELKATTSISAPDAIHVATAIETGCDLLVTLDTFLRSEAERFIRSCLPEHVRKVLRELDFKV